MSGEKCRVGGEDDIADGQARLAAQESYFRFSATLKKAANQRPADVDGKFPTGLKNSANNGIIFENFGDLTDEDTTGNNDIANSNTGRGTGINSERAFVAKRIA